MATTEHAKSTDAMDAVNVRFHEVSDSTYGLTVAFRDGKRCGVYLPKNGTNTEIAKRLRGIADAIDVSSVIEEPKAPDFNRIEALVPGRRPVFAKSNDEFGIITISATNKDSKP